jgi:flagellar biosynthesis protein
MDYSTYNKYQKYNKQAVALGYNELKDIAPKVVATGKGFIAEEIIRRAEESGIAIKKDEDLIKILSALEINEIVPIEAYAVIAEILSEIYKLNNNIDERKNEK